MAQVLVSLPLMWTHELNCGLLANYELFAAFGSEPVDEKTSLSLYCSCCL